MSVDAKRREWILDFCRRIFEGQKKAALGSSDRKCDVMNYKPSHVTVDSIFLRSSFDIVLAMFFVLIKF